MFTFFNLLSIQLYLTNLYIPISYFCFKIKLHS